VQKVFHLSHIDLDGYSCQLITKKCFENVSFYNSNYGKEINERIAQIISDIHYFGYDKNLIIITDLNLTLDQARFLTKSLKEFSIEVDILLLDHHKTGKDCASLYDWYHLDVSRCATKITYDYFLKEGYDLSSLENYVDVVNAIDIWIKEDSRFELGKVCMRLVSGAREINRVMFANENSQYIFFLLEEAQKFFHHSNTHIVLDDEVHGIKKSYFQKDENNTLENLVSNFIVDLLSKNRDKMSVYYHGHKGILTYSVGNVSIIGNDFLVKNPDFDFFMDINGRKNVSLRANNKIDVSQIAKELFGGGGHANASGGRCDTFKDSFVYAEIHEQIQDIMIIGENS